MEMEMVEVAIAGVRLPVTRATGFELLDRNTALVTAGRTETAQVPLQEGVIMHVLLGAGPIALLETTTSPAEPRRVATSSGTERPLFAADVFPDFDVHPLGP